MLLVLNCRYFEQPACLNKQLRCISYNILSNYNYFFLLLSFAKAKLSHFGYFICKRAKIVCLWHPKSASRKKPLCEELLFSLADYSLLIASGRRLASVAHRGVPRKLLANAVGDFSATFRTFSRIKFRFVSWAEEAISAIFWMISFSSTKSLA